MKQKETILFFVVVILGIINIILSIPIIIFVLDFYKPNFFNFFKANYDWILPSLTLISSLAIFLCREYKEAKRLRKASKPQLFIKEAKKHPFSKTFKIINTSNKAAINVKITAFRRYNFNKLFEHKNTKEFSILDEEFLDLYYEGDKISYYFDFIAKDDEKTFEIPRIWTYNFVKAFFYDLITENDLYYRINLKYNNEEYYSYNETFRIYFKISSITIYNEEYLVENIPEDFYIDKVFVFDDIIRNKKQILDKIHKASHIHPNLVDFDIRVYKIEKEQ